MERICSPEQILFFKIYPIGEGIYNLLGAGPHSAIGRAPDS